MADIDFGLGVLHVGVLRARLRRSRRRLQRLGVLVGLLLLGLLAWPLAQTHLRGTGTLLLPALPPQTILRVDAQPLTGPTPLLAGTHHLEVTRAGYYPITSVLTITRDVTTTLTLPTLRPRPAVQAIPLPAVGARWTLAQPDADGWQLQARIGGRAAAVPLRLDARGLTRQPALTSSTGIAAEQSTRAGRAWAAWATQPSPRWNDPDTGRLTIATPAGTHILTPTTAVQGLWWSPDATHLLIATEGTAGHELRVWDVTQPDAPLGEPLATIPGPIAVVAWHPDMRVAVILSTLPPPIGQPGQPTPTAAAAPAPAWDATLLTVTAPPQAIRLAPPPAALLGLVPLAWEPDALLWATDTSAGLALDRIPLTTRLPTRLGMLPTGTLAFTTRADGPLRLVVRTGSALTLQTWPTPQVLVTLDDVTATATMSAAWRGHELLLAPSARAELWRLTFDTATLQ